MEPETAPPTSEIERAAEMLRTAGWIVTPPEGVKYGCFCDLFSCDPGTKPDGCVIDYDRRYDCCYADQHERKEQCEYWKPWTEETIAAYWKGMEE